MDKEFKVEKAYAGKYYVYVYFQGRHLPVATIARSKVSRTDWFWSLTGVGVAVFTWLGVEITCASKYHDTKGACERYLKHRVFAEILKQR